MNEKKIIFSPVLSLLIIVGVLLVLLVLNLPPMSLQEKSIVKAVIAVLLTIVIVYFILQYLTGFLQKKFFPKKERTLKDLVEHAAPKGFKIEVSVKEKFTFCYPENWVLVPPANPVLYKEVKETVLDKNIKNLRNFNLSCQDISKMQDMDYLFTAIINGVMASLGGACLESREHFRVRDMFGVRYKINYRNKEGISLICYQSGITNRDKKKLLLFTFTSDAVDFSKSKKLFDKITSLVNIFD